MIPPAVWPAPSRLAAGAAIAAGGGLLLWPALLNRYPLVFSDTGAFLAQTVLAWPVWDKPFVYGPALHALHWRQTLWLPALAQGLMLSWLIWLATRVLRGRAGPALHLGLCLVLALGTAAPWFAALLMPDILAPALVLALFVLGFADAAPAPDRPALSVPERVGVTLAASLAIAAHLSHLPLAAAVLAVVIVLRRRWRPALRCAVPLAAALGVLVATSLLLHGRAAVSPHGAVFALARLVADGPAARTIAARCPAAGWHLCDWTDRLPADSDLFLWSQAGPVWAPRRDGAQPGGPISLAPEAAAIVAETLRREPLSVLVAALRNAWAQAGLVRVGDTLVPDHLPAQVGRMLALGFPPAEQARFAAGAQARGALPALAAPWLAPHGAVLAIGAAGLALALWRLARRRVGGPALGLIACVLVGLAANAAATGALSKPHARYQARIAWLLPLAALLVLAPPAAAGRRGAAISAGAEACAARPRQDGGA